MKPYPLRRISATAALVPALVGLLGFAPVQADDCNALVENMVSYLHAPRAPGECTGTYHIIVADATTTQVVSVATNEPGLTIEEGVIAAATPSAAPDTFMNLVMANRTAQQIASGAPARPVQPYEFVGNLPRRYSTSFPPFTATDTVRLHVIEGQPGSAATVELEYAPLTPASTPYTKARLTAAPTCHGSFMTGYFNTQTAFTIALIQTRGGSCS